MIEAENTYQVYGDRGSQPVVLLHGAAGTHLSWPAQVRRLPACRVYALDLPGHGKSNAQICHSIAGYARYVLEWLDVMHIRQAILVGHSMGSAVAMQAAVTRPGSVAALVLAGSGSRLKVNKALIELAGSQESYHQAMERIVAWSFSRHAQQRLMELALRRMWETPQAVLHSDLMVCDEFDISEYLAAIEHPTLVICGADDRMTPLTGAKALSEKLRQGRLEVMAEAGHMLMQEQPVAFAALLQAFIKPEP